MQLKKRLSVAHKTIAVSAFAAAMFMSSAPAFASEGHRLGFSEHASFAADIKGLLGNIRDEIKADFKSDKKALRDAKGNSASSTASVNASCRAASDHARTDALKSAATERDNELKAAHDVYLAALQSARNTYHADLSASSTVSAGPLELQIKARVVIRKKYANAVKVAKQVYAAAKHQATSAYRDVAQTANETYHQARLTCRVNASTSGTTQ